MAPDHIVFIIEDDGGIRPPDVDEFTDSGATTSNFVRVARLVRGGPANLPAISIPIPNPCNH
jgi:hypothetical protein